MATLKLNEKAVAALPGLPPDVAQVYYWDTELSGFGLVVGTTARTFVVRQRVSGRRVKVVVGRHGAPRPDGHPWTVTLARRRAQELLGEMAGGVDPNAEKRAARGGVTLRQGLEQHVANMKTGRNRRQRPCSPRSIRTIETEIPRLLGKWLDRPLMELTALELQAVLDGIEKKTKARAGAVNPPGRALANRLLAQVSAIWTSADRLHDLPGKNPARRIGAASLKPRDERIADAAFAAWFAKANALAPVRRELHLMALFTGLRSESLRHLRWEDIDEDRALLRVAKAKGGRSYVVPLLETHRELLERLRQGRPALLGALQLPDDGGWIFPTKARANPPRVIPLAEPSEEGMPGLHALRRTFNSVAAEVGIAQGDREALMGHAASGVNARHYTRAEDWSHLRACAERVEAGLWERIKSAKRRRG